MTLRELILHFENQLQTVDICTPAFRKISTIGSLLNFNDGILDMKVDKWKYLNYGVLNVTM